MYREGGIVKLAVSILLLLSSSVYNRSNISQAATVYNVGDALGWSFNVSGWANDKHFKVSDVLVFNYDPTKHNLVVEDTIGYDTCTVSSSAKIYQTGNESIELVKVGAIDFISSLGSDCDNGMKLEVITQY